MELYITAFTIGLVGSFHCIGMCGPLVMALPISQQTHFQKWQSILLYHAGKISSYAVLGILFVQPKIENIYTPKQYIVKKIWTLITVSIAAQCATFPLGILYFHQFPNYFLLSNLFVIPLATFIIGFGVFLFLISWYLPLSNLIVLVLNKLLLFLNFSVDWVQSLPHSLTVGVSVYKMETFLIYLIIILFIPAVIKRSFKLIKIAISLSVLLVIYQIYEKVTLQNQQYFIVYDVKGEQAIDFVDGSNNYFIADENLANDQSKMRFHIHHFRWKRRVLESNLVSVDFLANNYLRAGNHIKFFDKKILLWDKDFKKPTNLAALQLDYIIVSEKANINLENINCKLLIIDSSVGYYKEEAIKKECRKWDIPFYNVNTQGAYLFDITSLELPLPISINFLININIKSYSVFCATLYNINCHGQVIFIKSIKR